MSWCCIAYFKQLGSMQLQQCIMLLLIKLSFVAMLQYSPFITLHICGIFGITPCSTICNGTLLCGLYQVCCNTHAWRSQAAVHSPHLLSHVACTSYHVQPSLACICGLVWLSIMCVNHKPYIYITGWDKASNVSWGVQRSEL